MDKGIYCFKVDHPKIRGVYDLGQNYKVEYAENGDPNLCVIYFTSHALYFPDIEDSFIENVIVQDRYEWYKSRHINAGTHIFVRDVHKQWYLSGINSKINSINELFRLLRKLTLGKRIVCIGASAGGYAAILLGSMLRAEIVIAFNPQINLNYELQSSAESENVLLHKLKDTEARKYYDLNDYLTNYTTTDVFYVCSSLSEWDTTQCSLIRRYDNIYIISIRSELHGVPIPKMVLKEFISSEKETLLKFVGRDYRPVEIMLSISFSKTLVYYFKVFTKIIKSKLCH